jgi:competence protein ComEC
VTFSFLGPLPGAIGDNDASCVLLVSAGEQTFLLPGDIERRAERALVRQWGERLASTVLLAPHHGSRTSSSWAWLKAVAMREVVYSAGYRNAFNHPHPAVQARYVQMGVLQWHTAQTGAVSYTFETNGRWQRSLWRQRHQRFWH